MTTKRVRDLCSLSCVVEFAEYNHTDFFLYLIGTGVSRSRYEWTAHDRKTGVLLFDIQIEASAPALEARARKAGTSTDAQAVALAIEQAQQIVDAAEHAPGAHFLLHVEPEKASLQAVRTKWTIGTFGEDDMIYKLIVYGYQYCADALYLDSYVAKNGIEYEWRDVVEGDPRFRQELQLLAKGNLPVPTVVLPDGEVLVEPAPFDVLSRWVRAVE